MERFLFIAIFVPAFPIVLISAQLLDYLDKIQTKKTTREIKAIVILSALASLATINLFIALPQIVIVIAIILIIISVVKYSKKTPWDKKNGQVLFLSGLTWLIYFALEFTMRKWSRTATESLRVDLLFIAPILFSEAAIALCLAAVNLSDREKKELTNHSSR